MGSDILQAQHCNDVNESVNSKIAELLPVDWMHSPLSLALSCGCWYIPRKKFGPVAQIRNAD